MGEESSSEVDNESLATSTPACTPAPPLSIKLFVSRVPKSYTDTDLIPHFVPFGKVEEVTIIKDKTTNAHKLCAFVKMGKSCLHNIC